MAYQLSVDKPFLKNRVCKILNAKQITLNLRFK